MVIYRNYAHSPSDSRQKGGEATKRKWKNALELGSSLPPQRPKRIIVTSNYSITDCFGADPILLAAIQRRFREINFDTNPYKYVQQCD